MLDLGQYEQIETHKLALISAGGSESIGKNLSNLRRQSDCSRPELAARLNVCISTVARYEEGTRVPDIDTLINISNFFKVDINTLIH